MHSIHYVVSLCALRADDHISVRHVTQHVMCPIRKNLRQRLLIVSIAIVVCLLCTFYGLGLSLYRESQILSQRLPYTYSNIYASVSSAAEDRLQSSNTYFNEEMCESQMCYEFLDKQDLLHFTYCWKRTNLTAEPSRSVCRFLNASDRAPVALASFPGSGNTWVRGLLQAATGVCTGTIYCDTTLRRSGFPGESLRSGKTLVVKTHQTDPRWTGVYYPPGTVDKYFKKRADIPVYRSAIFVIRNPFHALVAEWSRQMTVNMSGNHIITIGEKYYSKYVCLPVYCVRVCVRACVCVCACMYVCVCLCVCVCV